MDAAPAEKIMLLNYRKRKNSALFVGVLTVFLIIFSSPARAELSREEEATIEVFERVSPSVVFIKNAALQWDWFSTHQKLERFCYRL